ncbi:hypothetical protein BJX76DRAFT_339100 [Aspergillus varians]
MTSLFEKCAYCGNKTSGFLFCSDPCRLAASPSSKSEAKESIKNDQPSSIKADPVVDSLEIVGSLPAELQIHATEAPENNQRELARYEGFFDRNRGKKKQI